MLLGGSLVEVLWGRSSSWKWSVLLVGGALDGGVYSVFDAGLETGAELHVAARHLAVTSALHEDEFGYGAHPCLTDA